MTWSRSVSIRAKLPRWRLLKKESYLKEYNRAGSENGWHFLTGPEASSRSLADSVGFRYAYDALPISTRTAARS